MSFCERIVATVTEQLRIFVGDHTPNGIYPECVTQEGMATECILSCAQQRAVNLIVIGTYGCRGFDRLTLGSVTDKVIQKARCPVLAVHKSSRELAAPTLAEHPVELREVVFCTNFSKESSGVLDYALSVAAEYKAKLTLVHVLEGISKLRLQDSTAKAYQCFDRLVPEQIRLDQGIATAVRAGSAYKEISQLASVKHADLVVMAVRDHKGLEDVFSATSYRVARSGECPVLAVYR
jgi:nucleotide-binding universal stress UspA family protein